MRPGRADAAPAADQLGGRLAATTAERGADDLPRPVATLVEPRLMKSPCCGAACCGGPARVWCTTCGRSFQADSAELTLPAQRVA